MHHQQPEKLGQRHLKDQRVQRDKGDLRIAVTLGAGALLFWLLGNKFGLLHLLFGDAARNHCFHRTQLWVWVGGFWSAMVFFSLVRLLLRRWRGGRGQQEPGAPVRAIIPSGDRAAACRLDRRSYITCHWRGELSLGVSWWVSGVLVTLGFASIGTLLKNQPDLYSKPQVGLGVAAAWMVAQLLVPPWQWIGMWRSAHNHLRATRRLFWATLVQILVVTNGMSWTFSTPVLLAMLTKSAVLQHRFSRYQVRLVNGESELEVRGPIGYHLAETVQQTLDRAPKVKRIHLNSPGGLMEEGRKLHDLIHTRRLETYSDTGCFSACTLAFVAGKERTVHERAKLGFHRPCLLSLATQKLRQELELQQRDYTAAGIAAEFVVRVQNTPPDQMWYPSLDELRQAGVITRTTTLK